MKNILSISFLAFFCQLVVAQNVAIGTGTPTPDASAVLDLQSTDKGLLVPRVANPASIGSPATGLMVYNTTTNKFNYYNGATWIEIGNGNGTVTSVSGTAPIVSSGGSTPAISIPVATTSADGYLSSTDWNTFNSKQSALTFSTGLTNASGTVTSNLSTGVSGGQSAIGGTAASNNLTLSSTSNATKGKILFGTSAYDEVNNRLGIGTASPGTPLDVAGTAAVDYLRVDPQDNALEGGEIQLVNSTSSNTFQIDNYNGDARIHTLASGKIFQVIGGNGIGATALAGTGSRLLYADANGVLKAVNTSFSSANKVVFNSTGANQTWAVPAGISTIFVKLWGAGGGGTNNVGGGAGGGGGFVSGYLNVTPGSTLTLVVGKGGIYNSSSTTYGGGGAGPITSGCGGGRTAIQISAGTDNVTAGGGGGGARGSWTYGGGGGGGSIGASGAGGNAGLGGSFFGGAGANGSYNGSQYTGGNGNPGKYAGGGGGGWYGGGGGGDGNDGPGGGGSSYVGGLIQNLPIQNERGVSGSGFNLVNHAIQQSAPGGCSDPDYSTTVGTGGRGGNQSSPNGGDGRIVIYW